MRQRTLHDMIVEEGGFTLDADGCVPNAGYAVGLTLNDTVFLQGRGESKDVDAFVDAHAGRPVGAWYDPDKDLTTLESVEIIYDRSLAMMVAANYGQVAIFDLKKKEMVDVD